MHLELGGKAPVIVFDDADMEQVVEWVKIAGYFNAGQDCTAATRVLVSDKAYDNVLAELVPAVESIKMGDPTKDDTEVGSVVSKEQLERVEGFVDRAQRRRRRGAHGRRGHGRPAASSTSPRSSPTPRRTPRSSSGRSSGRS